MQQEANTLYLSHLSLQVNCLQLVFCHDTQSHCLSLLPDVYKKRQFIPSQSFGWHTFPVLFYLHKYYKYVFPSDSVNFKTYISMRIAIVLLLKSSLGHPHESKGLINSINFNVLQRFFNKILQRCFSSDSINFKSYVSKKIAIFLLLKSSTNQMEVRA